MQARLLIIEHDPRYAEWLRQHLGILCPQATVTLLDVGALALQSEALTQRAYDLLILGASFAATSAALPSPGVLLLRQLRGRIDCPAAIVVADGGDELTAVQALRLGALDYLPKRLLTPQRLGAAVQFALRRVERRVARKLARLARATPHRGTGTSRAETRSPRVPTALRDLIPGYRIRDTLAESDQAVVYLAVSSQSARRVALKVSKKVCDANEPQLLAREYAALNAIRHRAIVEIFDYGTRAGHEFLAMEFFARGDLKSRLRDGLEEEDTLRYVYDIAAALRVVHEAGILHRDLKPPNVMLRDNDELVLIDFGLARHMDGVRSTRVGVVRGSPYYMSPEQALGEELDVRSDLYSLGVIYYELLTGERPYSGLSAIEVLQQHVHAPLPRLPAHLAHHEPLLLRMLAKARDGRCGDATEVMQAIAAARRNVAQSCSAA